MRGGFAVSNVPHLKGNTRLPPTDGSLFLDPDEVQKRRALRKEMRRKRRENMSQGTSMIERKHSIEDDDDGVMKDVEDMEESPLHSVMTNSDVKIEEKYLPTNLIISHKNISKACQIDTNEKISLEEQEARKSLLNIHSSQVGYKSRYGNLFNFIKIHIIFHCQSHLLFIYYFSYIKSINLTFLNAQQAMHHKKHLYPQDNATQSTQSSHRHPLHHLLTRNQQFQLQKSHLRS